jgi:hypothetical protein
MEYSVLLYGYGSTVDTYLNSRQAPYITKTKAFVDQTEIEILNICQGAGTGRESMIQVNNCFAILVQFTVGAQRFSHYVVDPFFYMRDSNNSYWPWTGLEYPGLNFLESDDGKKLLVLDGYGGGKDWSRWREDFFDIQGRYLGSYNAALSSTLVPHYKAINFYVIPDGAQIDNSWHNKIKIVIPEIPSMIDQLLFNSDKE